MAQKNVSTIIYMCAKHFVSQRKRSLLRFRNNTSGFKSWMTFIGIDLYNQLNIIHLYMYKYSPIKVCKDKTILNYNLIHDWLYCCLCNGKIINGKVGGDKPPLNPQCRLVIIAGCLFTDVGWVASFCNNKMCVHSFYLHIQHIHSLQRMNVSTTHT